MTDLLGPTPASLPPLPAEWAEIPGYDFYRTSKQLEFIRQQDSIPDDAIFLFGDSRGAALPACAIRPNVVNLSMNGERLAGLINRLGTYSAMHRGGATVLVAPWFCDMVALAPYAETTKPMLELLRSWLRGPLVIVLATHADPSKFSDYGYIYNNLAANIDISNGDLPSINAGVRQIFADYPDPISIQDINPKVSVTDPVMGRKMVRSNNDGGGHFVKADQAILIEAIQDGLNAVL